MVKHNSGEKNHNILSHIGKSYCNRKHPLDPIICFDPKQYSIEDGFAGKGFKNLSNTLRYVQHIMVLMLFAMVVENIVIFVANITGNIQTVNIL